MIKSKKFIFLIVFLICTFLISCNNTEMVMKVEFSINGINETQELYLDEEIRFTLNGIDINNLKYNLDGDTIEINNLVIKATKIGCTIITFYSDESDLSFEYAINVKEKPAVEITGENKVLVGKTIKLSSNYDVSWSSSDESIATINNGVVKGIKSGKVKISATYLGKYSTELEITVIDACKSIDFIEGYVELGVGDTYELKYEVTPSTINPEVEFSLSNPEVATIENNILTASTVGETIVIVKALDGSNAIGQMSVIIEDEEAPVVTYLKTQNIKLPIGTKNFDYLSDIKVMDNADGDITNKVKIIENNVNPEIYGTYVITCMVSDSSGNTIKFIRSVEVYWPYKTILIGHGGGYFGIMNTMEAIKYSVEVLHYPMIEVDLCQTSDGVFVLCHDSTFGDYTIKNTPWSTFENYYITKARSGGLPSSEGLVKNSPYTSRICLLTEALDYCREHNTTLKIELKESKGINGSSTEGMARLMEVIKEHDMLDKVSFTCFPYMVENLKWLRNNGYNDVLIQYLCGTCEKLETLDLCIEYNFVCSINPIYGNYSNSDEWIQKYKDAGVKLSAYTFDQNTSYATVQKWVDKGIDYITTDWHDPAKLNLPPAE